MTLVRWIVLLVALERLAELIHGGRNTRRLLAEGARIVGDGHYPLLVAVHAGWLAALWMFVPRDAEVNIPLLAFFLVLQAARLWIILSLGPYWTTRIVTLPGRPLVRRGPYRWVRHPNYLLVSAEIAVLPLAFGAWEIALVFSLLNAAALTVRIRAEDRALAGRRGLSPEADR